MKYADYIKQNFGGKYGVINQNFCGYVFIIDETAKNEWQLVGVDEDFICFAKQGNKTYLPLNCLNICLPSKIIQGSSAVAEIGKQQQKQQQKLQKKYVLFV